MPKKASDSKYPWLQNKQNISAKQFKHQARTPATSKKLARNQIERKNMP